MNSPLLEKSMDFAMQIVLFYEEFSKSKKDTTIAKQLLRSATSVGANINEAIYGNSKADFISKLHISLKETGESIYWLRTTEPDSTVSIFRIDDDGEIGGGSVNSTNDVIPAFVIG